MRKPLCFRAFRSETSTPDGSRRWTGAGLAVCVLTTSGPLGTVRSTAVADPDHTRSCAAGYRRLAPPCAFVCGRILIALRVRSRRRATGDVWAPPVLGHRSRSPLAVKESDATVALGGSLTRAPRASSRANSGAGWVGRAVRLAARLASNDRAQRAVGLVRNHPSAPSIRFMRCVLGWVDHERPAAVHVYISFYGLCHCIPYDSGNACQKLTPSCGL